MKINHTYSKRPHYLALKSPDTGLYWMVPCSSKVEKFEQLILKKQLDNKPTNSVQIVKIFDHKSALLFQDMFPVLPHYISGPYIKGGQIVRITNPKLIHGLEKNAVQILNLLHHGVKFTPTQPNIKRIEHMLQEELMNGSSLSDINRLP